MAGIKDDRGYNQGFRPSKTVSVRNKRRFNYILNNIDINSRYEILEIGCGLGDLSYFLAQNPDNKVLGTDLCLPFIEEAKKKYSLPNLDYVSLDINQTEKLNNRKFDYIVGNGILHHLYSGLDKTLKNLRNLLKNGGKIIFLEPNLLNPYCYLIFNTTHFFRNWAKLEPTEKAFTKTLIKKKLISAGFIDIMIEYKDFLIPVMPYSLIKPTIFIGDFLEKTPVLKFMSQSLLIVGKSMQETINLN